jgi:hypothetical protein
VRRFVTRIVTQGEDGLQKVLTARHHRKGLRREVSIAERLVLATLWQPGRLNWWIASIFALGSSLFAIGSIMYLSPDIAQSWSVTSQDIAVLYFSGSIPFTTAAYLQLYQAANAPEWEATPSPRSSRTSWLGWRPNNIGWVSSVLQFAGTLLFNINTFNGMHSGMNWAQEDLTVWIPDIVGSVLFLASGYLAFLESNHKIFTWTPATLSWWITSANFLGCIAFIISAVYAFVSPTASGFGNATVAVTFTLMGAIGFLAGSLLMLAEEF